MTTTPNNLTLAEGYLAEAISGGDTAAIIEAARAGVDGVTIPTELIPGRLVSVLTPAGWGRQQIDLSSLAAHPARAQASDKVLDTVSFLNLVRRWHTESTVIYVQPEAFTAVAVFDDHTTQAHDTPGWREHRLQLTWKQSPGWKRWAAAHREMLTQEAFAELVEDGLTEILRPAGADLLEMAQSFHATTAASFRSARRLDNGQVQLNYVEDIDARAGNDGQMTIPSQITLVLAPIVGSAPIEVTARLRYRVTAGKLTLGVIIDRIEDVLADAVEGETQRIRVEFPGVPVVYGMPGR